LDIVFLTYVSRFSHICQSFFSHMSVVFLTCQSFFSHMSIVFLTYVSRFSHICQSFFSHMSIVFLTYVNRFSHMSIVFLTYVNRFSHICQSFFSHMSIVFLTYVNRFSHICQWQFLFGFQVSTLIILVHGAAYTLYGWVKCVRFIVSPSTDLSRHTSRRIVWQLQCSGTLRKGHYVYQFIQTLLCHAGTMCNDTGMLFLCLSVLFMCS